MKVSAKVCVGESTTSTADGATLEVSTSATSPMRLSKRESTRESFGSIAYLDEADASKMGFAMPEDVQCKWDAAPPAYLKLDRWSKFVIVCKAFPGHWAIHNLHCLPLLVAAVVPLLVARLHSRQMINDLPELLGDWLAYEDIVWGTNTATQLCKSVLSNVALFWTCYIFLITQWSKKLMDAVALRYLLPFAVIQVALGVGNVLLKTSQRDRATACGDTEPCGEDVGIPLLFVIQIINISVGCITIFYNASERVGMNGQAFCKKLMLLLFMFILILTIYDFLVFPNVGEWSDFTKMLFCAVGNPLMWEIPLTIARAFSRTIAYNHPSTNYVMVALVIAGKKATGRFVLATIASTSMVTIASLILSCAEVTQMISVGGRDRGIYRRVLGGSKVEVQSDPLAVLKHRRNTKLRIQCANLETTLEIVFIIFGLAIVGLLNVASMADPENGKPLAPMDLVLSGLIQYACEAIVDFVIIAYLTVFANQAYLEYAHLQHRAWTLTMSSIAFFAATYVISNNIPYILYRIPPLGDNQTCSSAWCGHDADWVWLASCVQESNSSFNACL